MSESHLSVALKAVDWQENVDHFLHDAELVQKIVRTNKRLATWAIQFESIEKGNPALCFVREMQVAGHHAAALIALALYKPAASAIRGVVETALYYSYFRTHKSELSTLVRDAAYHMDKAAIIAYHKQHTPNFDDLQQRLGVVSRLTSWYGAISAVLHGQIPGKWVVHKSLAEIKYVDDTAKEAVKMFIEGEELVHRFFLCTVGRELWGSVSTPAKGLLLTGLPGAVKTALGLDSG